MLAKHVSMLTGLEFFFPTFFPPSLPRVIYLHSIWGGGLLFSCCLPCFADFHQPNLSPLTHLEVNIGILVSDWASQSLWDKSWAKATCSPGGASADNFCSYSLLKELIVRKWEQRNIFNAVVVAQEALQKAVSDFRGVHSVLMITMQLVSYKSEVRSPCECCDWRSGADLQPEIRKFLSFWEKRDGWAGSVR